MPPDWLTVVLDERSDRREVLITTTKLKPRRQTAANLISEAQAWMKECEAVRGRFGVPRMADAYEASRKSIGAPSIASLLHPPRTSPAWPSRPRQCSTSMMRLNMPGRGASSIVRGWSRIRRFCWSCEKTCCALLGLPDDFALEFAEGKEQDFAKMDDEEV